MTETISLPLTLSGEHWLITAVSLHAFTDDVDTPVHTRQFHLFRGMVAEHIIGNIFFLENLHDGNAYVILLDSPDYEKSELKILEYTVSVEACTSDISIIPCKAAQCEAACRQFYYNGMAKRDLVAMSNTWGDSNGNSRVCEEFVLREIDKAAELGVDVVQIDDGWQVGYTYDPARKAANGHRFFDDDFWVLDETRFPNGLKYVTNYAKTKGVSVGLWFAPDSREHFSRMERDIAILKNAYNNWGFRFFKLDMYWIENDIDRDRFLEFLARIYAFGDDVSVQLDVTRNCRINYLCGRQYGTVFVENRYTRTKTFFPHRTLKNLWLLSRYIPASRFQFELVNPDLYGDCYDVADEFATPNYDADYLFASVMLSNPLFWMEMQFLSGSNSDRIRNVVSVWKKHRHIFAEGDVAPIGSQPSGRSFTGFHIRHPKGDLALIFREVTSGDTGRFDLPNQYTGAEVLLSNSSVAVYTENDMLRAVFSKPRSYALLKLS